MSWQRSRSKRLIVTLIVAGIVSTAAYTYTATNTVSTTHAGAGTGTISGYTVNSVDYTLDGSDPQNLDSVTVTLSPTGATHVNIQLAAGGPWYSCSLLGGQWSCNTTSPQATAVGSTQLTVVAAQ